MTFTQPYGMTIGSSSASGSLNSQAITDMNNLGVTWLRYQIPWHLIDATGTTNQNASTYTWNAYDSAVSQCNAAGISILLSVMQAPSQFIDGGSPGNPLNPSHTATFAAQIATRYNGGAKGTVQAIEIGNEDFDQGSAQPAGPLVATLKTCYPAIKAVSSSIIVGAGCLLQRNSSHYTSFMETLCNPSTGAYISSVFQADYLNFHYYTAIPTSGGTPVSLDPTVDIPSWNGGQGLPSVTHAWQLMAAKMSQYGVTVPIWLTEFGPYINTNPGRNSAGVVSQATQWAYYKDILDSVSGSGIVAKAFPFTLGYYAGYAAPNYRDGCSLVQGTLASPTYTTTYNNLKSYISAKPTWGSGGSGGALTSVPSSLSFSATVGGASPANKTVTVTNSDSSSASYLATSDSGWLSVSPTSGSIASGGSTTATISANISGLAVGTYTGIVTWTAGALSDTTAVTLTVSSGAPPPTVTPLTAYFPSAASALITTANQIYTILGTPVDVNTATTLGTALNWGEVCSGGTTNPWAAATTAPGPSGQGFVWGAKTLENNDLQPGTLTGAIRLNMIGAGAVSITADLHVRVWKWNLLTGYNTLIADLLASGITILTTKTVFAPTATTSVVTSFGTGEKLYFEILPKILTNTGPSTAQIQLNDLSTDTITFTGSSTAAVSTPGYSPTPVRGGGGGGTGGSGTYGSDLYGSGLYGSGGSSSGTGASTSLTIGSIGASIEAGSLSAKSSIGRRGELSAVVIDTLGMNHYQQFQRCSLYDPTGTRVFSGYLTQPQETKPGDGPLLETHFTATDQRYLADKRIVAKLYRNQTVDFMVNDLYTSILQAEGVTIGQIASGLITVPIANFGYVTVADALDALANAASSVGTPFYWMIDQEKQFYFVPYTAITGPTVDGTQIDDGQRSGVTPSVTRANPNYRNTQYAVGGTKETGTNDETLQGDGQTRTFAYRYPLNAAPSTFTLNGTSKSLGVKGQSGFQYYYAVADNTIVQDSGQTVLVSTDRLRMVYVGQEPAVFNVSSPGAISAQAALDGTSGINEAVINDSTINSLAQGTLTVGQALTRYCVNGVQFQFATLQSGFAPGQLVTVTYAPFGFSAAQMLVAEVTVSDQADGLNLWQTITAVQGPYDTSWVEFFGDLLKPPGFSLASNISLGIALNTPLFPSTTLFPSPTLYPSG